MSISIKYQKKKNSHLFHKFKQIQLDSVQNYNPILKRFFSLNQINWNSIQFNQTWSIVDFKDVKSSQTNVLECRLKNGDFEDNRIAFIKMAPLLDPFKYVVGKYDFTDEHLFLLPKYLNEGEQEQGHPKIMEANNAAYIDSFFSFLTSQALHCHQFLHGVDFYGSFLAIKQNYKINVIDDIEYLALSGFFQHQKNKLFHIDEYSHIIDEDEVRQKPLRISSSLSSHLSVHSIKEDIFEDLFDNNENINVTQSSTNMEDITNVILFGDMEQNMKDSETKSVSDSSCSSRTSHTNEEDSEYEDEEEDEEDDEDEDEDEEDEEEDEEDEEEDEDENDEEDENWEEEKLMLTFPSFPVQVICLEKCEDTLDNYILNEDVSDEEWFCILMQIIMQLVAYQKMFSFTHNDLHTNNIMYVATDKKYLFYVFKKKIYRIPTYGKIFKIIDFGRAIYKFQGKIFCSDSFQIGGDASTQYNTEPYFNEQKPRLDPNFSFDLCRLACSIFDYVVEDLNTIKKLETCSPIVQLIVKWCIDDNGINVLYKNNGRERYPDFKLYKMIARCVHQHTPEAQLERPEFSQFAITNKQVPKHEKPMNIDLLPIYC
jgi:hypothetical protein